MNVFSGIVDLAFAVFAVILAHKAENDKKWVSAVFYTVAAVYLTYYGVNYLGI